MPVKVAVVDRDGTTYDDAKHKLVDGAGQMIERLESAGVKVFVVTNQGLDNRIESLYPLSRDRFISGVKGTKKLVGEILAYTGVEPNEVVYFGDSERDMYEAVNSRLAYFHAEYSFPDYEYGLSMSSPAAFADHVERYFLKVNPWYLSVDAVDSVDRHVIFRSLLDADSAKDTGAQAVVKGWRDDFTRFGKDYSVGYHVILHMISSLYLTGAQLQRIKGKNPVWCLYPGHTGDYGSLMLLFESFTARLLRAKYSENLLMRHTAVESSKEIKMRGQTPLISDQFNSIVVNPNGLKSVKGNVVLVADDFSTRSHAMETARNLLYAAGACQVIGVAVGKYGGSRYDVYDAKTPKALQPASRAKVAESDFKVSRLEGLVDSEVLTLFRQF